MDSETTAASHGTAYAPVNTARSSLETLQLIDSVCRQTAARRLGVDDAMVRLRNDHKITAHRPTVRRLLFIEWRRLWGDT